MIELQGKYSMAKVFTNNIESETISQITNLLNQDFVENAKVRIMPDCHKGAGCVIGFTADLGDKVIPNLVGVDIGCFVGDTKIPLLNGTQKTLEQLYEEGKEFWVYSVNKDKKIVNGKAKALKTIRNAELVKVTISGGEEIICTPDHEIMLRNGKYKQAKDLKYKDSLMPLYRTYQTRDGYESLLQPNKNMKTQPTHRIVAEEYFGNIPEGYVVHHKNGNQFDNTPENLKLLTIDEHSTIHGKSSNQVTRLRSPEFKQKRLQVLQEKGFYDDKYYNKKKEIAIQNITNYMNENKEDFKKVVQKNAERGSEFFSNKNSDETMIVKQKLGRIRNVILSIKKDGKDVNADTFNSYRKKFYNYPTYDIACKTIKEYGFKKIIEVIDKENWNKVLYNNHKVISVEKLDYKEDVYCLSVDKYHNFALSAGVFVHNCGMEVVNLGQIEIDLKKLDSIINQYIPAGFNTHEGRIIRYPKLQELYCYRSLKGTKRLERSIGTLGGGNHFLEINIDKNNNKYLVIHSGSRNLGKQVAEFYQNLAVDLCSGKGDYFIKREEIIKKYKEQGRRKEIQKVLKELKKEYDDLQPNYPKELCFLTNEFRDKYLHDMNICQEYAKLNRETMAEIILQRMFNKSLDDFEYFHTVHNYIDFKDNIIRKGAISAYEGEKVLIPINMRDGSILATGKGNSDWNYSAPHGAGRIMSRAQARDNISLEEFQKSMEEVYTTSVKESTLDEAPMAYKPIEEIISNIEDTVDILDIIKPIYNFKA